MPVPAHKTRRLYSLSNDAIARLDAIATGTKTHQGRIIESALQTHWKESVMPTIVCWTYEADHHCNECAEKRFGPGIPESSRDSEGNPPHPLFSTDELISEGEDNQLPIACGTCRGVIVEHPASQWCNADVIADNGAGVYTSLELAEKVTYYFDSPFELDGAIVEALQDPEWDHQALDDVIERVNDWLQLGTGRHSAMWCDSDPGILLLAPLPVEHDDCLQMFGPLQEGDIWVKTKADLADLPHVQILTDEGHTLTDPNMRETGYYVDDSMGEEIRFGVIDLGNASEDGYWSEAGGFRPYGHYLGYAWTTDGDCLWIDSEIHADSRDAAHSGRATAESIAERTMEARLQDGDIL